MIFAISQKMSECDQFCAVFVAILAIVIMAALISIDFCRNWQTYKQNKKDKE